MPDLLSGRYIFECRRSGESRYACLIPKTAGGIADTCRLKCLFFRTFPRLKSGAVRKGRRTGAAAYRTFHPAGIYFERRCKMKGYTCLGPKTVRESRKKNTANTWCTKVSFFVHRRGRGRAVGGWRAQTGGTQEVKHVKRQKHRVKKTGCRAGALALAAALLLTMLPALGLTTSAAAPEDIYKVDASTITNWKSTTGDNTKNVGRIWTDKSVFSETIKLPFGTEPTIEKAENEDFLVMLSALSSTAEINGETTSTVPMDIVLVLDRSGSMADDLETYSYTVAHQNGTQISDVERDRARFLKVGDQYIEVTVERDGWPGNRQYSISYTLNGEKKYLHQNVSGDTPISETLYRRNAVSTGVSKMQALKTAVNGFIDATAEANKDLDASKQHQVAIVSFADRATTRNDLTLCTTGDNVDALKRTISELRADGSTGADYAMTEAQEVLKGSRAGENKEVKKVVIFFTDGEPNHYSGFDSDVANAAIDTAKDLKDAGTTVYTVGVFENANPSDTTNRFNAYMHGVSSNYPKATSYTNLGDRAMNEDGSEPQYYKAADNADSLNSIFQEIASEINKQEATSPTQVTEGAAPDQSGYVTFTDRLGDYMQVSDFKAIVFADQKFEQKAETVSGNTVTYTFEGAVSGNTLYPDGNMNDIVITVERAGKDDLKTGDLVTVKVPANMLPLRRYDVDVTTINGNTSVTTKITDAYPIRITYGVQMKDGVQDKLAKPDEEMKAYISENKADDGSVRFYANAYSDSEYKVYSQFQPNTLNSFYYFQEDTTLYTDEACTIPATNFDVNQTYYYQRPYYTTGGEKLNNTIEIEANSPLLTEGLDKEWLSMEGGVLHAVKGKPRRSSLMKHALNKPIDGNLTDTASYVTKPDWGDDEDGKVEVGLGNNGYRAVDLPGALSVTKTVTAEEGITAPAEDFEFTVTFTGTGDVALDGEYLAEVKKGDVSVNTDKVTIENNKATFTLKDGQTKYIYGLPAGAKYEVVETDPSPASEVGFNEDKKLTTGAEGTIQTGQTAAASFTNNYTVEELELAGLGGTKTLDGRTFRDGDIFRFKIAPPKDAAAADITPLPTDSEVEVLGNGNNTGKTKAEFNFGKITFTKPGVYTYTITEELPNTTTGEYPLLPGITYDSTIYRLTLTVADESSHLALKEVKVEKADRSADTLAWTEVYKGTTLPAASELAFTNTFSESTQSLVINGQKTLNGERELSDYPDAEQFGYKLTAGGSRTLGTNGDFTEDTNQPMPDKSSWSDKYQAFVYRNTRDTGIITTAHIPFTTDDAGKEFQYYVTELQPTVTGDYNGKALVGAEKNGNDEWVYKGVTFDKEPEKVIIKVETVVNGEGETVIQASFTSGGDEAHRLSFVNSYNAEGTFAMTGTKKITGRTFNGKESLTFKVEAEDGVPLPDQVENGEITVTPDEGTSEYTIDFGEIDFTSADMAGANRNGENNTHKTLYKDFTYTITEQDEDGSGMKYDTTPKTVTIRVTDDGYGNLTAAYAPDTAAPVWNNEYTTSEAGYAGVQITKTLTGRNMKYGEFTFKVEPLNGAPEPKKTTVTNNAAANGAACTPVTLLNDLKFTLADAGKEYTYKITEENGGQKINGITYDSAVYEVEIAVSDKGDGTLNVETTVDGVAYVHGASNPLEFENTYKANEVVVGDDEVAVTVKKTLTGRDWTDEDSFTFKLEANDDNTKAALENDTVVFGTDTAATDVETEIRKDTQDLTSKFGAITFKEVGVYQFKVTENQPTDDNAVLDGVQNKGVTYDASVKEFTVEVTDSGSGQLSAKVQVKGSSAKGNVEGEVAFEFTNAYAPNPTSVTPVGTKRVETAPEYAESAPMKEFSFGVYSDADCTKQVASGKNSKTSGEIVFTPISVTAATAGTTYYVKEIPSSYGGISYDENVYKIIVKATDDGKGNLTATIEYPSGTELTFTNTYTVNPDGVTVQLNAKKVLVDDTHSGDEKLELEAGQFQFAIVDEDGNVIATAGNNEDGSINFPAFGFGVTTKQYAELYAAAKNAVEPPVPTASPEPTATPEATATPGPTAVPEATEAPEVTETPEATETPAPTEAPESTEPQPEATPEATDAPAEPPAEPSAPETFADETVSAENMAFAPFTIETMADEFETPEAETDLTEEAQTSAAAQAAIDELNKLWGDHTYTIKETTSLTDGYTCDAPNGLQVVINLGDDGEGNLRVNSITYKDKDGNKLSSGEVATFTNTYKAADGTMDLTAEKLITGREFKDGEQFTFELTAVDGAPMPADYPAGGVTISAVQGEKKAAVNFGTVTYTTPGTYTYKVTEKLGGTTVDGLTYDKTERTITVTVTDQDANGAVTGELKAVQQNVPQFVNTYAAKPAILPNDWLHATKYLTGRDLKAGEFEFEVVDQNGSRISWGCNDENGSVVFEEIADKEGKTSPFTRVGEYVLTVREIKGNLSGVTYDDTAYTVIVEVSDPGDGQLVASVKGDTGKDIKFNNTWVETEKPTEPLTPTATPVPPPTTPQTGDSSNPALWLALLCGSAAIVAALALSLKRRSRRSHCK